MRGMVSDVMKSDILEGVLNEQKIRELTTGIIGLTELCKTQKKHNLDIAQCLFNIEARLEALENPEKSGIKEH